MAAETKVLTAHVPLRLAKKVEAMASRVLSVRCEPLSSWRSSPAAIMRQSTR